MPKKYEDEIREILKGMDDVPGDGARPTGRGGSSGPRRPGAGRSGRPMFRAPSLPAIRLDPQRIMGLALILILLVVALIALLRASGWFKANFGGPAQRWRGQVIYLPNRQPFWTRWRHALMRLFRTARRPGPPDGPRGPRAGRDSYQW